MPSLFIQEQGPGRDSSMARSISLACGDDGWEKRGERTGWSASTWYCRGEALQGVPRPQPGIDCPGGRLSLCVGLPQACLSSGFPWRLEKEGILLEACLWPEGEALLFHLPAGTLCKRKPTKTLTDEPRKEGDNLSSSPCHWDHRDTIMPKI